MRGVEMQMRTKRLCVDDILEDRYQHNEDIKNAIMKWLAIQEKED
jgi:hypothetical protein